MDCSMTPLSLGLTEIELWDKCLHSFLERGDTARSLTGGILFYQNVCWLSGFNQTNVIRGRGPYRGGHTRHNSIMDFPFTYWLILIYQSI